MGMKNILIAGLSAGVIMSFASIASLADSTGWREEDGSWRFYTSDTDYVKDDWVRNNGNWYYFDEDGFYVSDTWAIVDGKLYCFDKNGAMQSNKWIKCGKNYDFAGDKTNWRYVGSDGAAYIGWKKVNGEWYYFCEAFDDKYKDEERYAMLGLMSYGDTRDPEGYLYHFDDDGHYLSNTWYQNEDGEWYYFGSNGKAYGGWKQIDNKWYLFGEVYSHSGAMRTGRFFSFYGNSYPYTTNVWIFDDNGVLLTGWNKVKDYETDEESGEEIWTGKYNWCYSGSDGAVYRSKWMNSNGKWYYFDYKGRMIADVKDYYLDGKLYDFNAEGVCTNANNPKNVDGWRFITRGTSDYSTTGEDRWVYAENGTEYRNQWLNYHGDWYYFDVAYGYDGVAMYSYMIHDKTCVEINSRQYDFDENGKCLNPDADKKTGWVKNGDVWKYYDENGHMYKGEWLYLDGKWYCFDWNGSMYTGRRWVVEKDNSVGIYYFTNAGEMITGWYGYDDVRLYADPDGSLYYGQWLNYEGDWYYFSEEFMVYDETDVKIDGKYYDLDENGKCLNPYSGRIDKLIIVK